VVGQESFGWLWLGRRVLLESLQWAAGVVNIKRPSHEFATLGRLFGVECAMS
jgi:hypothetical protein